MNCTSCNVSLPAGAKFCPSCGQRVAAHCAAIAHEGHAQRACHAALQLRDTVREYANVVRLRHGVPFGLRIGLNSGEVAEAGTGKSRLCAQIALAAALTQREGPLVHAEIESALKRAEYLVDVTEGCSLTPQILEARPPWQQPF